MFHQLDHTQQLLHSSSVVATTVCLKDIRLNITTILQEYIEFNWKTMLYNSKKNQDLIRSNFMESPIQENILKLYCKLKSKLQTYEHLWKTKAIFCYHLLRPYELLWKAKAVFCYYLLRHHRLATFACEQSKK